MIPMHITAASKIVFVQLVTKDCASPLTAFLMVLYSPEPGIKGTSETVRYAHAGFFLTLAIHSEKQPEKTDAQKQLTNSEYPR